MAAIKRITVCHGLSSHSVIHASLSRRCHYRCWLTKRATFLHLFLRCQRRLYICIWLTRSFATGRGHLEASCWPTEVTIVVILRNFSE